MPGRAEGPGDCHAQPPPGAWLAEAFAADSAAEILLEEVAGQAAWHGTAPRRSFRCLFSISHEPGRTRRPGPPSKAIAPAGPKSRLSCWALPASRRWPCFAMRSGADGYVCVDTSTHAEPDLGRRPGRSQQHHLLHVRTAVSSGRADSIGRRSRTRPACAGRAAGCGRRSFAPGRCGSTVARWPTCSALPPGRHGPLSRIAADLRDHGQPATWPTSCGAWPACWWRPHHGPADGADAPRRGRRDDRRARGPQSRHIMTRADLLILEVMMHLGEGYHPVLTNLPIRPPSNFCRGFEM